MDNVGKESHSIEDDTTVNTGHLCRGFGEASRSGGFQESLGSGNDAWEETEDTGGDGLGMFRYRRLADDSEQGDDIETPTPRALGALDV